MLGFAAEENLVGEMKHLRHISLGKKNYIFTEKYIQVKNVSQ